MICKWKPITNTKPTHLINGKKHQPDANSQVKKDTITFVNCITLNTCHTGILTDMKSILSAIARMLHCQRYQENSSNKSEIPKFSWKHVKVYGTNLIDVCFFIPQFTVKCSLHHHSLQLDPCALFLYLWVYPRFFQNNAGLSEISYRWKSHLIVCVCVVPYNGHPDRLYFHLMSVILRIIPRSFHTMTKIKCLLKVNYSEKLLKIQTGLWITDPH